MANNYLQFSEVIDNITPEEKEWWKKRISELKLDEDWMPGSIQVEEEGSIWLYGEEFGDPDAVARIVQQFLFTFRPNHVFTLQWAETCSKMRIGEFSGGAMVVTAKEIFIQPSGQFIADVLQEVQKQGIKFLTNNGQELKS